MVRKQKEKGKKTAPAQGPSSRKAPVRLPYGVPPLVGPGYKKYRNVRNRTCRKNRSAGRQRDASYEELAGLIGLRGLREPIGLIRLHRASRLIGLHRALMASYCSYGFIGLHRAS